MAEPLSVASSLITLAGFAFQASKSLSQAIESFKSVKRAIRELRADVGSLIHVLKDLQEVAAQNEAELATLKLPLLRCGKICNEFEGTLNKCYRGGDIADLRTTLSGYKATISIALIAATFRQATVTADVLDEYEQLVEETKADLHDHLENIDERFQSLNQRAAANDGDASDLKDTTEEKESTEQCLRICQHVSEFIERSHDWLSRNQYGSGYVPPRPEIRDILPHNAEIWTKAMLSDFRSKLSENSTTLKARLTELDKTSRTFAGQTSECTGGENTSLEHIKEERGSIVKGPGSCSIYATGLNMSKETASEAISLPTVSEIEAATEIITTSDASAKVVRVRERFAVKMGHGVPLIEAENMKFLAANSQVPVPTVYAAFRDPDTHKSYIIMEYLPGQTLEKILPSLNLVEKATISNSIRDAVSALRSIPPPNYFGMLNRQPYLDGVFWTESLDPKISGPFSNQEEMNLAILEKLRQTESDQYIRLLRHMVSRTLSGHRPVFTHGDLQPKNIMIERLGDRDGRPEFRITLLDWESAGWYPEFWEFCNATIACRFKPGWLELVPDILDQYPVEFFMMQVVYSSVFY
ncbi:hypothetical protein BBP40_002896 [Aspergillus hancockii]|nr:hypothetical protein BBP40_002896 [Aspergillus hancockii]